MPALFISYRRSDSTDEAQLLNDRLCHEFGQENVFFDIHSMPLGNDFPTVLANVLNECKVVLVVIGPEWAVARDKDSTCRLLNPARFCPPGSGIGAQAPGHGRCARARPWSAGSGCHETSGVATSTLPATGI